MGNRDQLTLLHSQEIAIMLKPRFQSKHMARLAIPAIATTGLLGSYLYYRTPTKSAEPDAVGGQAARSRQKRDKEGLSGTGIGQNTTSGGHETGQPGSGIQEATSDAERAVNTTANKEDLPSGGVGGGPGGGQSNTRSVEMSPSGGGASGSGLLERSTGGRTKDDLESTNLTSDNRSSGGNNNNGGNGSSSSRQSATNAASSDGTTGGTNQPNKGVDSGTTSRPPASTPASNAQNAKVEGEAPPPSRSEDYQVHSKSYPTSGADHNPARGTIETGGTSISQKLQGAFGQGGKASSEQGEQPQRKFSDTKVHSNHAETPTKRGQMRSDS